MRRELSGEGHVVSVSPENGSIHFGSSAEITPPMPSPHNNCLTGYGTTSSRAVRATDAPETAVGTGEGESALPRHPLGT